MRPLEGIKILDFTQTHAGSLGTMQLADFGAEVIKVERPGVGDLARYWAPFKDGESGYFAYLNRNKKSISINGFTPEGKEIIYKMVKDVDIVCNNFKYGSMEKMGFDYETLRKINPKIIYASLNGFGQSGVMKNNVGLDIHLQAMSGMMDRTGFPEGPPTRVGAALGDHISGNYMAIAINLALIHRDMTGEGQMIDIAILDSLVSIMEDGPVLAQFGSGAPARSGNRYLSTAPYDTFKTKDGYLALAVTTERQWKTFCKSLNREDLIEDPAFSNNDMRELNYEAKLKPALETIFADWEAAALEETLSADGISCSKVNSVSEVMDLEQVKARNVIQTVQDTRLGPIQYPGPVIRLSKTPGQIMTPAPELGADSKYYLSKFGYTDEEIKSFIEAGVVEATPKNTNAEGEVK